MFTTPKKKLQSCSGTLEHKTNVTNSNNNNTDNNTVTNSSTTSQSNINPATVVLENGTMMGAVTSTHVVDTNTLSHKNLIIPEIIISASYSSNSLNRSRCDMRGQHSTTTHTHKSEDSSNTALESTALLEGHSDAELQQDEFEQFVLNRTTSESNILESSIYSELQFAPSIGGGVDGNGIDGSSGGPTAAQVAAPQQLSSQASSNVVDMLNSSACSRESRQNKRTRRKHKSKSKCSVVSASGQLAGTTVGGTYPPQYTAIFLDPHHHHHHAGAANVMGQIANAAASSPFLNAPVGADYQYQHQHLQFYQQQPMLTSLGRALSHHMSRPLLDARTTALPMCGGAGVGGTPDGISPDAITSPNIATTSTITPPLRNSFRKWFSRPSLPFVIGILALGGVACTLGGIVLGSTGLIEHSTQYLSAALLMIGIGVSLLVISGAIWRLSLPDDVDECPCYRHMEACRNCNSPYCNNRLLPGSYLYPEFQHRPPPPSYLTSLNECAAMGLLFHPAAQSQQAFGSMRGNTPPPLYRSTNSLSVFVPGSNAATTLATPAPTAQPPNATTINMPALNSNSSILPDQNALTMSVVMENLQAQTQPMTKEINYLELD